ncbi:DUF4178 domain-containing protein [Halocynthiibacter namhaensis]|uniref:DUF4178 domain-containing protein n=1 Tax=Halocynthiibacter namhaensis TaxID=1290553 RepID=UPI0006908A08|nr:DUF4178 domain-containing protein [Halocynthiibacter namhaensis]
MIDSFVSAKMTTCESCETTLFLDGQQMAMAGKSGVMHDIPQLFHLGETAIVDNDEYQIVGHARFEYGPGSWDEYWALDENGTGRWISVDEGIVILQKRVSSDGLPAFNQKPKLGETFRAFGDTYRVTEVDQGICVALRGSFPKVMALGETFEYVNCLDEYDEQLSGEFSGGEVDWFRGVWCDPFEVRVVSGP